MKYAALALVLGWAASLALPVATFGPGADETWAGWAVLMLGWLGFLTGQFAWLANFSFVACLFLLIRPRAPGTFGLIIGGTTLALALHALSWSWVYRNEGSAAVPTQIAGYHAGYYVWIASTAGAGALLLLHGLLSRRKRPA
jgi:hypothetical protein